MENNMKLGICLIVGVVAFLALYIFLNPSTNVSVIGTVASTVSGSKLTFIDFIPDYGGAHTSVAATGGSYSVTLLGKHSYDIKLHYSTSSNPESSCDAGTLNLQGISNGTQHHDIIC